MPSTRQPKQGRGLAEPMFKDLTVGAVIPARDEQDNIGAVVSALLALQTVSGESIVDDIVVCDNGSRDATAGRAEAAGARVVSEPTPGYGIACLRALAAVDPVDVVLFVDGDQAFDVSQAERLLDAIAEGADLVIGSRVLGRMAPGALSLPQIAGNRVAGLLIRRIWRQRVTDLGPFRAVRREALRKLDMRDKAYGWTVEMQIKAIQWKMHVAEVPVDFLRRRHGKSKVGVRSKASSVPVLAFSG